MAERKTVEGIIRCRLCEAVSDYWFIDEKNQKYIENKIRSHYN